MQRREFLSLLCSVAAWPLSAHAQPAMRQVGVLVLGNPDPEPFLKQLREGLRELGYVDGRNIQLEVRSAQGNASMLPDAAADLV